MRLKIDSNKVSYASIFTVNFLLLQNVWKCTVFFAFAFKVCKSFHTQNLLGDYSTFCNFKCKMRKKLLKKYKIEAPPSPQPDSAVSFCPPQSLCFFYLFLFWLTESCCSVVSVLFALSLVGNLVLVVGMRVALAALGGSPALRMRRVRRILRCSCILRKVLFVAR
jgi:hypothetical protein